MATWKLVGSRLQAVLAAIVCVHIAALAIDLAYFAADVEHQSASLLAAQIADRARSLTAHFSPDRYAALVQLLAVWDRRFGLGPVPHGQHAVVERARAVLAQARRAFTQRMRQQLEALMARFADVRARPTDAGLSGLRRARDLWVDRYGWFRWSAGAEFQRDAQAELAHLDAFLERHGMGAAPTGLWGRHAAAAWPKSGRIY